MKGSYFFYVKKVEILPVFVDRSIPDENKRQQELASLLRAKEFINILDVTKQSAESTVLQAHTGYFVQFCVRIVKFYYFL